MKDRQFMTVLALVVAAGLVMGLIAFRMTGGSPAVETAAAGNSALANPNAPHPSAADAVVDPPVDAAPLASETGSQNGEPTPPAKDAPEMGGPGTGDAPGTAYDPQQPSAPAETSSATTTPSSDAPPQ
jgi:hypothetical protein